jgi:hypothetical protein
VSWLESQIFANNRLAFLRWTAAQETLTWSWHRPRTPAVTASRTFSPSLEHLLKKNSQVCATALAADAMGGYASGDGRPTIRTEVHRNRRTRGFYFAAILIACLATATKGAVAHKHKLSRMDIDVSPSQLYASCLQCQNNGATSVLRSTLDRIFDLRWEEGPRNLHPPPRDPRGRERLSFAPSPNTELRAISNSNSMSSAKSRLPTSYTPK